MPAWSRSVGSAAQWFISAVWHGDVTGWREFGIERYAANLPQRQ